MQKQNLGKFKLVVSLAIFGVMAVVGVFGGNLTVKAANINANQVLGQVNSNGAQNFTNILPNSEPQIKNDHGFDFNFEFGAYPDIALDALNHRLFVSDSNNHRVLVFNLDASNNLDDYHADKVLGQVDFNGGQPNKGSGVVSAQGFNRPGGLVYDSARQYLFVIDTLNSRVLVFNLADGITNGEDAQHVLGQTSFSLNGTQFPANASSLNMPYSMALDSARELLFISDSGNNRVLVFNLADGITDGADGGEVAIRVLGQADFSSTDYNRGGDPASTTLSSPLAVEYSAAQKLLFVSDSNNARVLVYDVADTAVFADGITNGEPAVHVLGQVNFTDNLGGISQEKFQYAAGMSLDDVNNHLFISDPNDHRVLVYDLSDGITDGEPAINVIGQINFTANGHGVGATRLTFPRNINYTEGKLYVVDFGNHRVLVFNVAALGNFLAAQSVLGQLNSGMPDFVQNAVNSGSANEYGFNRPLGMAKDEVGHKLFVADAFNHRVLVFNLDNNNDIVDYRADYVLGQADFSGNVANRNSLMATANTLSFPTDVEFVATTNLLLVSDQDNHRVVAYNLADGITNGEDAVKVIGQADFDNNEANRGGAVSASTLQSPRGMDLNSDGSILYVVDANNHRVLAYNLADGIDSGVENAIHVLGQSDLNGHLLNGVDGVPASSTMFSPNDVLFDSVANRLFVTEGGNHRALVYNLADGITNGEGAVSVLGQVDFAQGSVNRGGGVTAETLNSPYGVVLNQSGNILYVSDGLNNRVLAYNLADGITNGEDAIEVIGSSNFTGDASAPARAKLNFPTYLFYNSTGNSLLVSDLADHRVVSFNILTLPQTNLPNAAFGVAYDQTINPASNDRGTVRYSGVLPGGLELDSVTGKINGAPTVTGNLTFTIKATDTFLDGNGLSNTYSAYQTFSVVIPASFHLPFTNLTNGVVGVAYNQSIDAAVDFQGDVTYEVIVDNLPNGLTFDTSTQVISGMPTASGTFTFTIEATDTGAVTYTDTQDYTITILDPILLPATVLPNGTVGTAYTQTINAAVNGQGAVTYAVTANILPNGLALNAATGAITGNPTVPGTFNFTITATDAANFTDPENFSIIIVAAPPGGGGNGTGGGGGGGGGGGSPAFNAPIGGFTVAVESVVPNTNPAQVNLRLNGGTALRMAIANTPDFAGVGQQAYRSTTAHTLTTGNGPKSVYARFFDSFGTASPVVNATVNITGNAGVVTLPPVVGEVLGVKITRLDELVAKLKFGQTSDEVKELQTELKKIGYFAKTWKPTKFYGTLTKAAVKKYLVDKNKKPVVAKTLDELVAMTKFGQRSDLVKQLQTELKKLKFLSAKHLVTNYYGAITKAAVAKYLASKQ